MEALDIDAMTLDAVTDFINANRDRYVRELTEYLAIPSVSALPDARRRRGPLRRVDGGPS